MPRRLTDFGWVDSASCPSLRDCPSSSNGPSGVLGVGVSCFSRALVSSCSVPRRESRRFPALRRSPPASEPRQPARPHEQHKEDDPPEQHEALSSVVKTPRFKTSRPRRRATPPARTAPKSSERAAGSLARPRACGQGGPPTHRELPVRELTTSSCSKPSPFSSMASNEKARSACSSASRMGPEHCALAPCNRGPHRQKSQARLRSNCT